MAGSAKSMVPDYGKLLKREALARLGACFIMSFWEGEAPGLRQAQATVSPSNRAEPPSACGGRASAWGSTPHSRLSGSFALPHGLGCASF